MVGEFKEWDVGPAAISNGKAIAFRKTMRKNSVGVGYH